MAISLPASRDRTLNQGAWAAQGHPASPPAHWPTLECHLEDSDAAYSHSLAPHDHRVRLPQCSIQASGVVDRMLLSTTVVIPQWWTQQHLQFQVRGPLIADHHLTHRKVRLRAWGTGPGTTTITAGPSLSMAARESGELLFASEKVQTVLLRNFNMRSGRFNK